MASTEQMKKRIRRIVTNDYKNKCLEEECMRLIDSGAVNVAEAVNNYRLPKNLLVVALENLAYKYRSLNNSDKKEIRNLRRI